MALRSAGVTSETFKRIFLEDHIRQGGDEFTGHRIWKHYVEPVKQAMLWAIRNDARPVTISRSLDSVYQWCLDIHENENRLKSRRKRDEEEER